MKITSIAWVQKQISAHRGEWEIGEYQAIDHGYFSDSTICRAIRELGFSACHDDCGNVFAKFNG